MAHPLFINLGSGKDFREDCINIDINPEWEPDIVADLNRPLVEDDSKTFKTDRFGEVALKKGEFEQLFAFDVLEHIPDLVTFMRSCLDLLKVGGRFQINVPYDLSYGAWQDPTHLHAFNERSWLYYTDWSWYLGFGDSRFVLDELRYMLNPIGKALLDDGKPIEEVARTPRAVDSMWVLLRKVMLTEEERAEYAAKRKRMK